MNNEIRVVIGSWGSYNECNERALGSKWLTLNDYSDWEEIVEELNKEGFDLEGIDEELFIQDIEGLLANDVNWDYVHPERLFELLYESGVLSDEYEYEKMCAFLEIEGFECFERRVKQYDSNWGDDITLYKGYSWQDLGYHFIHEVMCYDIPEGLENYIDYEAYGESFEYDGFREYEDGIISVA